MTTAARSVERMLRRGLSGADRVLGSLYGSRFNPIHHSGAISVALLVVLIVTGLYLLLFYRVGAPYDSTATITAQAWGGRWIRSLHRFASDAAVVAILVHALKMFAQGRSWGPRVLAWVSGVFMFGIFMLCGWTGYVLVWDLQAQVLAAEAARLLDILPILSEPLSRTFLGERPIPSAFFFMTLFLHVALPLGMGIVLWLHVSRLARPKLLPPQAVTWTVVGALTLVSIVWPVSMGPRPDPLRLPVEAPYDFFFAFWIPLARALEPGTVWLLVALTGCVMILIPFWTRPASADAPPVSVVDERLCTGCEQCSRDCPFEAISMVARTDGRADLVARVDPDLCVSCGICAGSCAPMVVGPPGRSGRDQLARAKQFIAARRPASDGVVVIGCSNGAGDIASFERLDEADIFPISCAGSLHTSVIEYLVRTGAGVLVVSCPMDACRNREGTKWLEQRMFHEREAELKERVDRNRVHWIEAGSGDRPTVMAEIRAFRDRLRAASAPYDEDEIDLIALCDRATEEVER